MNRPGVSGDLRRAGLLGLSTAVAYLATGYASTLLTQHGAFVSAVWPANAIALVVVLRACRTRLQDAAVLIAAAGASAAIDAVSGHGLPLALAFAAINLVELVLAVVLARRFAPLTYPTPADGWKFCVIVGLPAPILGAALAAGLAWFVQPELALDAARAWLTAGLLGFLLIAPFGMTISWKELARLHLRRRAGQAAAVAGLLGAITLMVFLQDRFPLQFLILPAMLYATFHFRLPGATASAMVVAVISLVMTFYGHGPMMLVTSSDVDRTLILQLFVTVGCLTMLPVAAALNQRDRYAKAIEKQRLEAVAANDAKSRLLAQVSHELRSPLSAIMNFSMLIERGALGPDRIPAFAAIIARNGEMLKSLADDLLDSMALESGSLSISPAAVALQPLLDELEIDLRPKALASATDIVILASPALSEWAAVTADPTRYRQILNNLATNAIKYGAGHGPVQVTVSDLQDFLRVEFANGGPGIPLERQDELFRPFSRLGAERTDVEGSGMGLVLTKQLVELQGGRIDFESVNERTRFWVDLPKAA